MNRRTLMTGGIFIVLAVAMVFAVGSTPATGSGSTIEGGIGVTQPMLAGPCLCCSGTTGNVDCDPSEGVDISDLSRLVDYLYVSFAPLCCADAANIDGDASGGIDISDLSALVDYLYVSFTLPAPCAVHVASFANQIQPIFNANCAVAGCHTGVVPTGGLNLSAGNSYAMLVNVMSSGYAPAVRVVPCDTLSSVLWHKIHGTGVYGQLMPRFGPKLPQAQLDLISTWIAIGAPNN